MLLIGLGFSNRPYCPYCTYLSYYSYYYHHEHVHHYHHIYHYHYIFSTSTTTTTTAVLLLLLLEPALDTLFISQPSGHIANNYTQKLDIHQQGRKRAAATVVAAKTVPAPLCDR